MYIVGADQKRRWGRRAFCAAVALIYGYVNTLGVSAAEGNFWNERRKTAERYKASSSALPAESTASDLTREQNQLLAQLPAARQVDFRSMEPTAAGGLTGAASAVVTKPSADLGHIPSWISTLVLPYGTLRDLYIAPKAGAPLVVHIQDAHGILEAQKNMGALIQGLQQERGISLVGLEGASGAFAMEAFRAWPDADVLKAVAETLLREDAIGGPEFAGLTAPTAPLLWGVEDKTRYEDNIQSFKDSLKNKPAAHEYLSRLESASKDLKARVFSPALRDFDRHAAAYAEGRQTLGVYVKFLLASGHGTMAPTLNLRLLAEALHWEENLDFKKVERDRQRLVEVLARTLPEKRLNQLVQQSLLYRAGRMTYGEYYRFMRSLCAENGVSLAQYGEINDYITYVLLAEKINRNDLLMELAGLEAAVQDKLAGTVPQKRLVAASRSIALLQKLTGHAMTPADWLAYEKGKWDVLNVSNELKVVSMDAAAAGSLPIPAKPADLAGLLAPFEGFCSYALSRNNALVENLLAKMTAEKRPAAVLVAGGFHTDGLTQILRRKDVSYVVVTPRIEDIPKDQNYLDVFARDPLPLEQLFTGERINLIDARPLALDSDTPKTRATVAKAASLPAAVDAADGELSVPTAQVEAYINGLPGIRNARVTEEKSGALGFAWEWVKGGLVRFFTGRQKGKTVGSSQVGAAEIGFTARPPSLSRSLLSAVAWARSGFQALSFRASGGERAMSTLPSYRPNGPNFVRWAHFWEWVYQVPLLGLLVRPAVRGLQSRFLAGLKASPLTADRVTYGFLSKKDFSQFVGMTKLGVALNLAGSAALIGGFVSGAAWALVPAALVWSAASAYGFAVAHVKKTPNQKVWAFAFGFVLAAVTTLPLAFYAAGGFPVRIPVLGDPHNVLQVVVLGLMANMSLHFLYNVPIRAAQWISRDRLVADTRLGRAILWLAGRSTMAVGDDGKKKPPLHRLPTGTLGTITTDLSSVRVGATYLDQELFPAVREIARLTGEKPHKLLASAFERALHDKDLAVVVDMFGGKMGMSPLEMAVLGKVARVKWSSDEAKELVAQEVGSLRNPAAGSAPLDVEKDPRALVSHLAHSHVRAADLMVLLRRASIGDAAASQAIAAVGRATFPGDDWNTAVPSHVKALLAQMLAWPRDQVWIVMQKARTAMVGPGVPFLEEGRSLPQLMENVVDAAEKSYEVSTAEAKGGRPEQQDRYVEFRYKIPGVGAGRFLAVADGANGSESAEWVKKNVERLFKKILQEEGSFRPAVMTRLTEALHDGTKALEDVTTFSMVVLPDDIPRAFVMVLGDSPVRIRGMRVKGKVVDPWSSESHHNVLMNPAERARILKIPGVVIALVDQDETGKYTFDPIDPNDEELLPFAHVVYNGKPMLNVLGGFGLGEDAPFIARTGPVLEVELDAASLVALASDGLERDDFLAKLEAGASVTQVMVDSLVEQLGGGDNRVLIAARMLPGMRAPSVPDEEEIISAPAASTPPVEEDVKTVLGASSAQLSFDLSKVLPSLVPIPLLSLAFPALQDLRASQVAVIAGGLLALFFIVRELARLWPRSLVRVPYMRLETLVMLDILGMPGHGAAISTRMRQNRENGLADDERDPKHPVRAAIVARLGAKTDAELEEMTFPIDDQPDLRREVTVSYLKSIGEGELARRLDAAWRRALHRQVVAANLRMKPNFREERIISGVYLSPMPLRTTHMAPGTERRFLLEFKERLAAERLQPGSGELPLSVSISDQHGSIDKFDALLLDAARRALPPGSLLPQKLDPAKPLSEQGLHAAALLGKLQIQNQGDLMDRGPFGLKVARRSMELQEMGGLSSFVIGNHDLLVMKAMLSIQYPWYEDYNFHGYQDEDGDVAEFVRQKRASNPDLSSPGWWAQRMDRYVRHHWDRQKTVWSKYEDLLNGPLSSTTQKRARDQGIYQRAAVGSFTPEEQKLWNALRGRNSAGQDIATGVRAVGLMSAQWWGTLATDLEKAWAARRAAPNFNALSDDAQAWFQGVEAARAIADEVHREVRERVENGEWWWRAFQAINHQNYTSPEWYALDWVFHDGWGSAVFKELNDEIGLPGAYTPANYTQSVALQEVAGFFRKNFSLFEKDLYQNTYMHALLPVDPATGEFFFTYKGREYRGKGGASFPSAWEGLRRISGDVRDERNGLPEIYEALSLVNGWYADNTTVTKPNDVLAAFGTPEKLARFLKANGMNRFFSGHIPYKEFSALKSRGVSQGFNWGDGIFFTDHGMGAKFEGRGGAVHVGANGLALRGYEHGGSKDIVENPRTVELAADGTEKVLFENTGIPRDAFLERVAADVDRRLAELDRLAASPASRHGLGGVIYPLKSLLLAKPRFYLARYPTVARFMETGYDLVLAPLMENGLVAGIIWGGSFLTGLAAPDLRWVGWATFLVFHLSNVMSKGDGSRAPPFWGWTLVPAMIISAICIPLNLSPVSFDALLVHFSINFLTYAHYKLVRGVEGRLLEENKAYSPRGFEALLRATGLRWLASRLKYGRRINLSKELRRVMGLDRRVDRLRFILEEDERKRARGEKVDERKRLQEVEALLRDWPDILGDERNLFDKVVDRVTDGNSSIHTLSEQVEDDLLRRGGTGSSSLSSTALYTALFTKLAAHNGIPNVAAFPDHFKSFLNRVLVDADMDLRDNNVEGDAPSAYFGTDIVLKGLTPLQVKDRFDESIPKALKQFKAKYAGDVRRHWESVAAEEGKKRGMSASERRKFVEKNVKAFDETLSSYVFYSSHRGITLAKADDPFVKERLASLEGPDPAKRLEAWEAEFEKERGIDKARLEMYAAERRVSRNRMQELAGKPGPALSEAREDYNAVSRELDDYLKGRRLKLARWGRVFIDGHWFVKDSKVARKMASRAAELLIVDAITELKARSVLLEQAFQQEGLEGDSPLMAVIREEALSGEASAVLHGPAIESVLKRLIGMSQDQPELLTEFFERLEDGRTKRLPAYNSATGRLPRLLASTRKIFNPRRKDADKTYVEHMVSLEKGLRKDVSSPEALRAFLDSYDNYRTAMDETHLKAYEDPRESGVTKLEYGDELAEADADGTLTEYREHLAYKKNEHEKALLRSRADSAKDERAQKMGVIASLQGPDGFFILMRRYGDETLLANRSSMDSGSKRPSRAPMSLKMVAANSRRMVRAVLRSGGFAGIFSRAWRMVRRTSRLWAGKGFVTAFAEVNGLNAYMAEFGTDERDSFRSGLMKSYIRHGEHFRNRDYNKFVDLVNKDLMKLTEDPEIRVKEDSKARLARRIHMTVKYKDERMPVFIPAGADPDSNDGVRYIRSRVGQYFIQEERGRTWRPIRRESIPDVEPAKRLLTVGLVFHRSPVLAGWLLKMFHFLNDVNALQKDTFFFNKAIDSEAEEIEQIRQIKKEEEEREAAERKNSSFPPPGGKVSMPSMPPPGTFTLTLPLWEWVFAGIFRVAGRGAAAGRAYARSSDFSAGLAPWLELPLLPGASAAALFFMPSLPLWAAALIGAGVVTAAHGRQDWSQAAERYAVSFGISFISLGLGSVFYAENLPVQFIFKWAWAGLFGFALHALYNAAVPALYRLTLSAPAMPSPSNLSAYGNRDGFTLLRAAQARKQLTVELLSRVVDEIDGAGLLPEQTPALRARIKSKGLGATEDVASACESIPAGTLSDEITRLLLVSAGFSVDVFNPSFYPEIEEALRVPEIGRAVSRLNVHVLTGSLPAVPGVGVWESAGILTSWDDSGVLNFYIHKSVLHSWRDQGNGRQDYLRNALIMAFFYKTAVARGVKENGLLPTLDLPALDELYKRKKQRGVNNITRELARRGRVLLSRAPKTAVHGHAAEIEHEMYMSHPQRLPSEQNQWARTLQRALTAARQAYGSRTIAGVGRKISLYEHGAAMAVRAAEWGAGEDAVLAMLYQPLYLRNPEEAGRVLRDRVFPTDPARAGRVLGFILRLENVLQLPYNPPADAAKAIQYHMGFLKAHLGKDAPEEVLRMMMVERSSGLLSAPTAEEQMDLYRQILYIYTPLAERLGKDGWAAQMRDESFAVMEPRRYKGIQKWVVKNFGMTYDQAVEYMTQLREAYQSWLDRSGIPAKVHSRVKGIYSLDIKDREIADFFGIFLVFDLGVEGRENDARQFLRSVGNNFKDKPVSKRYASYDAHRFMFLLNPKPQTIDGMEDIELPLLPGGNPRISVETAMYRFHDFIVYKLGRAAHWMYNLRKEHAKFTPEARLAIQPQFDDPEDRLTGNLGVDVREWIDSDPDVYVKVYSEENGTWSDVRAPQGAIAANLVAHRFINPQLLPVDRIWIQEPDGMGGFLDEREIPLTEPISSGAKVRFSWRDPAADYEPVAVEVEKASKRTEDLRTRLFLWNMTHNTGLLEEARRDVRRDLPMDSLPETVARVSWKMGFQNVEELVSWLATRGLTERGELIRQIDQIVLRRLDFELLGKSTIQNGSLRQTVRVRSGFDRPGLRRDVKNALERADTQVVGEVKVEYFLTEVHYTADIILNQEPSSRIKSVSKAQQRRLAEAADKMREELKGVANDPLVNLSHRRPLRMIFRISTDKDLREKMEWALSGVGLEMKTRSIDRSHDDGETVMRAEVEAPSGLVLDHERLTWMERTLAQRVGVGEDALHLTVEKGTRTALPSSIPPSSGAAFSSGFLLVLGMALKDALPQASWLPAVAVFAGLGMLLGTGFLYNRFASKADGPGLLNVLWARWQARRASATDDKSLFRREIARMLQGLAPVSAQGLRVEDRLDVLVKAAKGKASLISNGDLAVDPALVGKALYPLVEAAEGVDVDAVVSRLNALPEGGVRTLLLAVEDRAVADQIRSRLGGMPVVEVARPAPRQNDGDEQAYYYVDDVLDRLPEDLSAALGASLASGQAALPLIPLAAEQWNASDRYKAAVLILQAVGGKLLRVSMQAMEDIRKEMFALIQA